MPAHGGLQSLPSLALRSIVVSITEPRRVSQILLGRCEGAGHVLSMRMEGVELTVLYCRCSVSLLRSKAEMTACAELSSSHGTRFPFCGGQSILRASDFS